MAKEGDFFGDGVNATARLEGLVRGGEICVSRGVRDHLRHRGSFVFEDLGEQLVKNIAHPVRAFRLRIGEETSEQEIPSPEESPEPSERPSAPAVLAFLIIGGIGAFVGTQLTHLAGDLPKYQTNIAQKIHSLRHTTSKGGIVDRASEMVNNLSKEIAKPTKAGGNAAATQPTANLPSVNNQQNPVPVEVRQAASTPLQLIYEVAAPLLQPLATAGIVVVTPSRRAAAGTESVDEGERQHDKPPCLKSALST
jgi:hypothetical protein